MRKILLSVVLATTLAFTSCQFDDSDIWSKLNEYGESIRDHEQRISALEELCKQMNTNIEALQTLVKALEERDYVTNVSEVRSNGEVIGYTISFANSDTITIYHGQDGADGKDGANGKDGYTPQIGVMKDTDGIYYWTLDGEWLLDAKGNKIQANGVNGADGTNGSNGTNGTNGVTPQLKIENDYWYVSYDNGATWTQLGKATGNDGLNGENGEDGDSIFNSVTQDDGYVYFNLADGTMITLPKHDKENIQFEDLQVKAICCKNWDTNNDGELSYAEAAAVTDIGDVFSGNTNIIAFTELKYFTGITEIPDNAFDSCTALWKVVLPENVQTIGSYAFSGCESISNIDLPNGVLTLGNSAFANCNALLNVHLSEKLESIGNSAFYYCTSLTTIAIPNSVTSIEANAFSICGITKVIIPNSVTSIGASAFSSCLNLTTIEIGDGILTIPTSMSASCSLLTTIIIGEKVEMIKYSAFSNCVRLTHIYCKPTTPPKIYYSQYGGLSFPIVAGMKIYVPRENYEDYMKYSSKQDQVYARENWCIYESYLEPYDF